MAVPRRFVCKTCNRSFLKPRGLAFHEARTHLYPRPEPPHSTFHYHADLNAQPCNEDREYLPNYIQPPGRELPGIDNWFPFDSRPSFQFAELIFKKVQMSAGNIDELLEIWAAHNTLSGSNNTVFKDAKDLYSTLDSIPYGDAPWSSFTVHYTGELPPDAPSWKRAEYTVYCRDARTIAHNILDNPGFDGKFDYIPFEEYTGPGKRQYSNLISGRWAHRKATHIAQDPATHGAMFVPVLLGADKTTVSVATGNNEFHPVYMSLGNLHNSVRQAHRDAILPIAFLSIPKAAREQDDTDEFRLFKKQLYHASLAHIMSLLKAAMTTPEVVRCPDTHFRCAIYELGPFLADYPEQVLLAGVVSNWCPICDALPEDLGTCGEPRCQEHMHFLLERFDPGVIWTTWGLDVNVIAFTSHFPRADIHELITPDLLHQLIKGTFKDHLVTWVEHYLHAVHPTSLAEKIMDDIDRRCAVYLPAITGHVPDEMVKCFAALLDFCYLARRSAHNDDTLAAMQKSLDRNFGSPNGVCTSITESKHIRAVKEPWRRSSRNNPLGQMLVTNQRLDKLAAMRPVLEGSGMLKGSVLANAMLDMGLLNPQDLNEEHIRNNDSVDGDNVDVHDVDGPAVMSYVELGKKPAYSQSLQSLANELNKPDLEFLIRRFVFEQLQDAAIPHDSGDINVDDLPSVDDRVRVYRSASATFFAPSELAGDRGMHREFDTVLISLDPEQDGMKGMVIGRVLRFLSVRYKRTRPDPVTGMWVVKPEMTARGRSLGIIHIDSIVRAVHLIGVYGDT
ncbi:hypothetical protein GLOTRDRAFT_103769 [Gloeophyllum trabeum ATCC 11539]|uniref:C2H2-type domain-containing protein n=1 Tax=Gloeophyllum trabeum (strain ATCC 11539 / FP-39264 / Madison 617) TaxID=670483 RepID=S7QKS9_GLOTA|nr:uncharacterized protein GLOTRDRAFT_103769 [Gloeophyllum trabeum ATCC 11539]EPQ59878.1 hypothetical protein GLOTRDRAFT_103769 [Gloeophyllum trabeum ATCC 11539]